MAELQTRTVDIAPGAALTDGAGRTLGTFADSDECIRLRRLICQLMHPTNGAQYRANLTMPNGMTIGPIDAPFAINVLTSVTVIWTTTANTGAQSILLTLADLPDDDRFGANYLASGVRVATPVAIPAACVAVSVFADVAGVAQFNDAAGAPLCSYPITPSIIARPRRAEFIQHNVAGGASFLFHY